MNLAAAAKEEAARVMTGPPYPRRRRAAYPASTERTPPTRQLRGDAAGPEYPARTTTWTFRTPCVDDEESTVSSKTWFITGTSRGFGREWAEAALERGDSVAATARDAGSLDALVAAYGDRVLPIALDVTDREAAFAAVQQAHERFGRLDVVVNNAGYGQFGMVEELSEAEARDQIETNLFGALWVTQAALPYLRAQGSGHILQVSSIGGISAFPTVGIYHASKWALEGISQALAQEVAGFGIKVTLIEPGGFSTDWGGSSAGHATPIAAYDGVREVAANRPSRSVFRSGMDMFVVGLGVAVVGYYVGEWIARLL